MDIKMIINFKAYRSAMGKKAFEISRAVKKIIEEEKIKIGVAPQFLDSVLIKRELGIPVFVQHVDPFEGKYTGTNSIYILREYSIDGFLINHSEKKVTLDVIEKSVEIAKDLGLISVVCSSDPEIAEAVSVLDPDIIAVEPPELIGTGKSVSKVEPEIITETIKLIRRINSRVKIFVGAGISSSEDIKKAIELGADGVLLASAVAKARDPYKKLKELVRGFK